MIVHIGAGKAGSTAIQDFMRRNMAALEAAGYFVPGDDLSTTRGTARQVGFFDGLVPLDDAKVELVRRRLQVLAQHSRMRGLTPIITAENLINRSATKVQFADLFAAATDLFEMTVIVYVRRQDDFMVSSWTQWHFKGSPDFREWCARESDRLGDWDAAVRCWEDALPDAQFRVRSYDRQRLVGGDVVTDFMALLELSPDGFEPPPDPLVNRSLNELSARVMVRNRHLFEGVHDHRFIRFLRDYGGDAATTPVNTGLFLSPHERRELVARHAESNERLRRRHLPELPEGGLFSDEYRELPMVDPQSLTERELDLLWTVVFAMHKRQPRRTDRP